MDGRHFDAGMSATAGGGGANGVAKTTEKKTKDLTLVFCRKKSDLTPSGTADNEILLGLKKRGFGEGKWNGEPSLPPESMGTQVYS